MCESPLKTLENLKIEFCKVKYYFLGRAFAQFVEKSLASRVPNNCTLCGSLPTTLQATVSPYGPDPTSCAENVTLFCYQFRFSSNICNFALEFRQMYSTAAIRNGLILSGSNDRSG